MSTSPNVVPGAISTMSELGKDGPWLRAWLRDQPARLGLGDLKVTDAEAVQDGDAESCFLASDDARYFCVGVRLGEFEAAHGFGLLDDWSRNRARHPDKTHVAVLVTESAGDRYRSTLETLSEHLPLVVIELQVWRGENEAILVPHVALASTAVDLSSTPAAAAAKAIASSGQDATLVAAGAKPEDSSAETKPEEDAKPDDSSADTGPSADAKPDDTADAAVLGDTGGVPPESKDDTGVVDPWGTAATATQGGDDANKPRRLLTKVS